MSTVADRTSAIESEVALLGSCLHDRNAVSDCSEIAPPFDIAHVGLRAIYQHLQSTPEADVVELATAAAAGGMLSVQEAKVLITQALQAECSGVRAREHATAVHEAAQHRRLKDLGMGLATEAASSPTPSSDLIEKFASRILGLLDSTGDSGVRAVGDVLPDVIADLAREQAGLPGLDTGFPGLNEITGGFQRGSQIVIAARPSAGKTTLGMNVALMAARSGGVVYFVTVEMSGKEITRNLLCNVGAVSSAVLRTGRLSTVDWQRVTDAAEAIRPLQLMLDASAAPTPMTIRNRARRLALKHGRLDLIVVDYLQLLRAPEAETREQQVSAISRALKQLARELDCPVIAVSQLNRAPEARKGKQPQLGDLRESGAIEQDADLVILLHERDATGCSDGPSTRRVDAIVAKNRNGRRGVVPLTLRGPYFRFEEAPR